MICCGREAASHRHNGNKEGVLIQALNSESMSAETIDLPGAVGQIARLWPLVCARKIYTCNDNTPEVLWHPSPETQSHLTSCLLPGCCSTMEEGDNKLL